MAVGGLLLYLYYARQGQFDDLEDVKYDLFRNEEKEKCQKDETL